MNLRRLRIGPGVLLVTSPLILALVLRAGYLVQAYEPPETWRGDPKTYRAIAEGLLRGELISDAWIWPPGYPILGILLSVPGGVSFGLMAASFLSGLALPALALWAGRAAQVPWTGFFAALILATDPTLVDSAARVLSESPQLALLAGSLIALAAALRTKRHSLAILAGVAGGLSALSRPESLPAVALAPIAAVASAAKPFAPRRAVLASLLFGATALLVLAPFLWAFHSASGTWGLSLKLQMNVLKDDAFGRASDYAGARAGWDRELATYQDSEGQLDARRLAAAVSVRDYLSAPGMKAKYLENLRSAWDDADAARRVLWTFGLIGLIWPTPAGRGARWIALATLVPFFVVPVVFAPMDRYGIAAIPGLAWGTGSLLARAQEFLERRVPRSTLVLPVGAGVLLVTLAAVTLPRRAREFHWVPRHFEISAALGAGDLDLAENIVQEGLRIDQTDSRFLDTLGVIRERRGDGQGAEIAYRAALQDGRSPYPVIHLAGLLARTGRTDEAKTHLMNLRRNPPEDREYWLLEGHIALLERRWSDAERSYVKAEELGAKDPSASFQHGTALLSLGRLDDATLMFYRASLATDASLRDRAMEQLRLIRVSRGATDDAEASRAQSPSGAGAESRARLPSRADGGGVAK